MQNWDEKYGALIFHVSIFPKNMVPYRIQLCSCLPITLIKNEWLSRVHPWIFGYLEIWNEFGVEPKFGQNKPCPEKPVFFQNFGKKTHKSMFGTDLEAIWRFQIFGYLDIWTDRQIVTGRQLVMNVRVKYLFVGCTFVLVTQHVWVNIWVETFIWSF